jgi:hypothetical protein
MTTHNYVQQMHVEFLRNVTFKRLDLMTKEISLFEEHKTIIFSIHRLKKKNTYSKREVY